MTKILFMSAHGECKRSKNTCGSSLKISWLQISKYHIHQTKFKLRPIQASLSFDLNLSHSGNFNERSSKLRKHECRFSSSTSGDFTLLCIVYLIDHTPCTLDCSRMRSPIVPSISGPCRISLMSLYWKI